MDLGQIVRRNRARIVFILLLSTVNFALLMSILAWAVLLKADDTPGLGLSLALGVGVAAAIVAGKMLLVARRTAERLFAVPLHPDDFPVVTNLLDALAIAVGTPPVRAAYLRDKAPNAMAVGLSPKRTTIIVTQGLLEKCTRHELEAVLAVEMCSVRRLDTALQTVALACASGALGVHRMFRDDLKDPRGWFLLVLTWPSMAVGELIRTIEMRRSDFAADAMAVAIIRNPVALDKALRRLDEDPSVVERLDYATAPLWFEPVPHRDEDRASEFRKLALTPSLSQRRARLPHVQRT